MYAAFTVLVFSTGRAPRINGSITGIKYSPDLRFSLFILVKSIPTLKKYIEKTGMCITKKS